MPIGNAWRDQCVLLDGEVDGTGELIAAGAQIGRYWNPADADRRFVAREGMLFYRTGDRARRDPARGLVFAGRADRQVKIKGHRVELEDCERAIRARAATDRAFVLADGDALVCLLDARVDGAALATALRDDLPPYMVPMRFVALESVPLTPSGKPDHAALRALLGAG